MGNTNIPQFGAVDTANSRDTLQGDQQLTPEQKKQRDAEARGGLSSLLPDSVANESQRVVDHADHGKKVIGIPAAKNGATVSGGVIAKEHVAPDIQPDAADRAALAGHVGTGHSPSDAT